MIHPVIMAGGIGSCLWSMTRQLSPKRDVITYNTAIIRDLADGRDRK